MNEEREALKLMLAILVASIVAVYMIHALIVLPGIP